MQEVKTAIIYCRVSSADQVEGTSLDTQDQVCRDYAARQGWEVLEVFVERGESAKTADRTQLKAALAYCAARRNRVGFFVVYKVDRFARNVEDHVLIRMKLRRAGTTLVSATEPISSTPAGRLLEWQMAGFAEFDNSIRAERSKAGMIARMRQGIWVWPAPLGYRRTAPGANLTPHPTEAPLIRLVFEEFANGTHTYESLAKHVDVRGFRTRKGHRFRRQTIEKILHTPVYAGVIEAFGERVDAAFEPIVPLELWQRCQPGCRLWERTDAGHHPTNPQFPLRRLLTCSECGAKLTGSSSRGRSGTLYPYYHHPTQRGCSKATFVPVGELERLFVEQLAELRVRPEAEALFRKAVEMVWASHQQNAAARTATATREIAHLRTERQRIFDLHRARVYTDSEFAEQKTLLDDQIRAKSRLVEHEAAEAFNVAETLDYASELLRHPDCTWNRLETDFEARLRFQRLVFPQGLHFDGEQLGTSDVGVIYAHLGSSVTELSEMVARVRQDWKQMLNELAASASLVSPKQLARPGAAE